MHENIGKLGIPGKPTGVRETLEFHLHKRRIAYDAGVRTYDLLYAQQLGTDDINGVLAQLNHLGLSSDQFLSGFLGRQWEHDTGCKNPNIRIPNPALMQTPA